jgi:DNA primase
MVRVSPGCKLLERRIQAAKEGIDLLTVTQDLTTLRKKSERWRGKCPICDNGAHSDAFSLDDNLGLWHCFACGAGGDLVRLVELWGPFSVSEAVAWLGHTYNLDLPERPDSWFHKQSRQARLRERLQEQREMVLKRRLFKIALLPLLEDATEAEIRAAWEDFKRISVWTFVKYDEPAHEVTHE